MIRRLVRRVLPSAVRHRIRAGAAPLLGARAALPLLVMGVPARPPVRVYYGHPRVPAPTDRAHGGIVKFQDLQALYPNSPGRFNVLYLVSSRLPPGVTTLARLAARGGARFVLNQNGVAYPAWHGPGWARTNAPMATLLHAADHVFYQSLFCRESADRFLGPRRGPCEVLYNAVDTSVFTPGAPPTGTLVLLLGGTQYQRYRLEVALRVLREVRRSGTKATLLVTGRLWWHADEAASEREAHELVARLGVDDAVRFLGPYRRSDATAIFRSAHLLIHTKVNDPCPTVVIEAMSCGLPVVYSRSGGVPELVGAEAGIGVRSEADWERDVPPDTVEMAAAVLAVAERRAEYAEAARTRAVEGFDIRPWVERHRAVFETLA